MTTRMTSTHCTSTIAWRFTTVTSTSTECTHARTVSPSLVIHTHIWLKFEPCPHSTHDHHHGHPCGCCLFDLTSSFYLFAFLLSVFLSLFFHLSDEQQPELNKKIMENLCDSANNGGEGTYDVLYLPTGSAAQDHMLTMAATPSTPPTLAFSGHDTARFFKLRVKSSIRLVLLSCTMSSRPRMSSMRASVVRVSVGLTPTHVRLFCMVIS